MTKSPRADLFTRVTDKIIADLSHGVRTWTKPWSTGNSSAATQIPIRHNNEPYKGINILLLWSEAIERGYQSPKWMTYRQANELGGQVRKGETGSPVVYAAAISSKRIESDGSVEERDVYLMRAYTVFNTEQIDGLADATIGRQEPPVKCVTPIERAERFFGATSATVRHGGALAYYSEIADAIQLPHPDAFHDAESYAATKAHEFTHWTKHRTRLNRDFGASRFGDEGYAREELVAELGAAFLCAALGVSLEPREDHAAYLGPWLKMLKADNRAIFTAAAHAQRAVDLLSVSDLKS